MQVHKSIKRVPVYEEPCEPAFGKLLLHLLPGREIRFSEEKKFFGASSGRNYFFVKTTAGWALVKVEGLDSYFESPTCPVCFCGVEDEPSFKLPCCKNHLHAECFMHQIKSGHFDRESRKARKYDFMHLKCPCCRTLYDENLRWTEDVNSVVYGVDGSFWSNTWRQVMDTYRDVKYLVEEQERGLTDEEKGGWAIFNCQKCTKMYIPGKMSCAEEMDLNLEEQEFVCPECEWQVEAQDHRCFKHGKKYAMFKCDSCCSIASWDCFYNHYCERCHNRACDKKFYPCPGKGKCPLGMPHPPNCEGVHGKNNFGFVIGCYKCCDESYEPENYNEGAPDPFLIGEQAERGFELMFKYEARPEEEMKLKEEGLAGRVARRPVPAPRRPVPAPVPAEEEEEHERYNNFVDGFGESESESESEDYEVWNQFAAALFETDSDSEDESAEDEVWNQFAAALFETDTDAEEESVEDEVEMKPEVYQAALSSAESKSWSSYIVDFLLWLVSVPVILACLFYSAPGEKDTTHANSSDSLEKTTEIDLEEVKEPEEKIILEEAQDEAYERFLAGFDGEPYSNFLSGFTSETEETDESESETYSDSEPLWTTEEEDNNVVEQQSNSLAFVPREESFVLPLLKSCSREFEEEPLLEVPSLRFAESY